MVTGKRRHVQVTLLSVEVEAAFSLPNASTATPAEILSYHRARGGHA